MNLAKAIHLLVAAKEDAVLAAWAFMVTEFDVAPTCDISPYDAWDSYQRFYDLGLVTEDDFRRLDPERAFFARSAKPSRDSIQGLLYTFNAICKEPPTMSKSTSQNPFERTDTAIAPRESTSPTVPVSRAAMPLSSFGQATSMNPFGAAPAMAEGMVPARRLRNDVGPMFAPQGSPADPASGLPCRDSSASWDPEVYCCRTKLKTASDGGQVVGPDDLPGGSVSVIDTIFHAHCAHCGRVWHFSVGMVVTPDMAR